VFSRRRKPYARFTEFLPIETAEDVLQQILDREQDFCRLKGNRNFLRLPQPLHLLPGFSERLSMMLPQIESSFGVDLTEPEIELYVHAYNDGTYFLRHADTHGGGNWRRRISCVYYVHRRPRPFAGGDLVVYDRWGSPHAITAEHNSAIFFPAELFHEVRRIDCASRAFADSRFSINVWIM
jgi:Rps23 Pro-64 3,4-dihydroxylase Tpa1-like proline 4-hydroxylase